MHSEKIDLIEKTVQGIVKTLAKVRTSSSAYLSFNSPSISIVVRRHEHRVYEPLLPWTIAPDRWDVRRIETVRTRDIPPLAMGLVISWRRVARWEVNTAKRLNLRVRQLPAYEKLNPGTVEVARAIEYKEGLTPIVRSIMQAIEEADS
jgi:hypothetical protein